MVGRYLPTLLLASTAVLAANPGQSGPPKGPGPSHHSTAYDVAIVGAGLSGLSAADKLISQGKNVIILEALDRVGGKVLNYNWRNGGVTELGAAFVGPTQDYVLALAQELGIETFEEYQEGNNVATLNGTNILYPATEAFPPLDDETLGQIGALVLNIDTIAAGINVSQPWNALNASALDAITFQDWANEFISTDLAQAVLEFVVETIYSATPKQLSALYALTYIAKAGNETEIGSLERLIATKGGAQQSRLVGGTGLLPEKLAIKIGLDKIHLNTPINAISQGRRGHYLIQSANESFLAERVIVAISPPVANLIAYDPPLSIQRQQLQDGMFMGNVGKANARYKEPFWRAANLSGMHVGTSGTVRATFDDSDKDGTYGAIMGFLESSQLVELENKTDEEIQALVLQDYVKYFGPEAEEVEEWAIVRWDRDLFARGGPTALAGPGIFEKYGAALKEPDGGIFWAGTEGADYWAGFMDGAVRSGIRAAEQVLAC